MSQGVILWDFDGTLANRPGLWSACVLEVLDEQAPGHSGTLDQVRAALKGGFPWHRHQQPHPELSDPDAWWAAVTPLLAGAIEGCGIAREHAGELAGAVRLRFTDASRGWQLFEDSRLALSTTAAAGWRNAILSNHVPELPQLAEQLGLGELVETVISSASIGYEKPHPEAFRRALAAVGNPARRWMVGDNPIADVAGAEALGIPAVLVRTTTQADRRAADAVAAAELIIASAQGDGQDPSLPKPPVPTE